MVPKRILASGIALALTLLLHLCTRQAAAQTDMKPLVTPEHIAGELQAIETAAAHHATDDELGKLWRQLASDYLDEMDIPRAEGAYDHALKLLRGSVSARSYYASALDGMASLYLLSGQIAESENCRRKALAIFDELGDRKSAAVLHGNLAGNLLREGRYKEAEKESSAEIEEMAGQASVNPDDIAFAFLVRSYARCFQHRCREALSDAEQAYDTARTAHQPNSLDTATSLATLGYMEWKTGDVAGADEKMRRALQALDEDTGIPHATLVNSRIGILRQYQQFLKQTHRKAEAQQVENEMVRLSQEQTPVCGNCTVNVEGLSNALH